MGGSRRRLFADAVHTRLWPIPAAAVTAALIAGILLPELDAVIDDTLPPTAANLLFGGSADAGREVLGVIASSLITVTALTFSLTLVTLQLASSQYTPRLLRTFAADRFVQRTLALFLATFVYALTVLRTVRSDSGDDPAFVPRIAVTFAFVLTMLSVLALVLFLAHLVRQIRIETMLHHVHTDSVDVARRFLDPRRTGDGRDTRPPPPTPPHPLESAASGFLVSIDEQALLRAATEAGVVIWMDRAVGDFLVAGTPIGDCHPAGRGDPLDPQSMDALREQVTRSLGTGLERTATQDIGYGLRQLVDVAIRALSPGINDPTTAIHALSSCSSLLCELSGYQLGPVTLDDDAGITRVRLQRPTWPELLDLVCSQPRRYGAQDPVVLGRLLSLLRDVAWRTEDPHHTRAITDQLGRLERTASEQNFDAAERGELDTLAEHVRAALEQHWTHK
ncbi:hypothetical protein CBI38_28520 [Rhodococcus oxybenzonivorans]|uniref:DUF2254 domain-containing protein n=1 Tax=Rhodococcus oxybenzonivorans TaxID=1990687 RepID=A0A2S2C228_9NOCA|nr:DUF2254 domain-containing protein [Rhodococcus oxybenzonivorans]AWK74922.1 hypothetical protein CBI38_28520 [Rhodococcus oxybenzonivorans]